MPENKKWNQDAGLRPAPHWGNDSPQPSHQGLFRFGIGLKAGTAATALVASATASGVKLERQNIVSCLDKKLKLNCSE